MAAVPEAAAVGLLNHLLRRQSWATARLLAFAGKTVRLAGGPLAVRFTIREDGLLTEPAAECATDAELSLRGGALLERLAVGEARAPIARTNHGDAVLGAEVGEVLAQLRWDVEEDLSLVFGDVLAHRMALAGAGFLAWQRDAALNLARTFAEYWTEEQPLLAKPGPVRHFLREMDELRDAAERLEQRVGRLEAELRENNKKE